MTKNQKTFDLLARQPISLRFGQIVFDVNNGSIAACGKITNFLLSKNQKKWHRAAFLLFGPNGRAGPPGFVISNFRRRRGPQDP